MRERLAQTLDTLEARRADPERDPLAAVLERLEGFQTGRPTVQYAERVSVDLGQGGIDLIEVATISHFVAQGRGTVAMTNEGPRLVDHPLGELERRLDPRKFVRIHRNVVVNLDWVRRVEPPRGGGLVVKLKDEAGTELEVARERMRGLKERFVL
jgi:two-component system LytT family response regulator